MQRSAIHHTVANEQPDYASGTNEQLRKILTSTVKLNGLSVECEICAPCYCARANFPLEHCDRMSRPFIIAVMPLSN